MALAVTDPHLRLRLHWMDPPRRRSQLIALWLLHCSSGGVLQEQTAAHLRSYCCQPLG